MYTMSASNGGLVDECLKCGQLSEAIEKLKQQNLFLRDKLLVCEQQNRALNHIKDDSLKCLDVLKVIVEKLESNTDNRSDTNEVEVDSEGVGEESVEIIKTWIANNGRVDNRVDNSSAANPDVKPVVGVQPEVSPKPFKTDPKPDSEAIPECEAKPDIEASGGSAVRPQVEMIDIDLDTDSMSAIPPAPPLRKQTVYELKQRLDNSFDDLDNWMKQLNEINCIQSFPRFPCVRYVEKPVISVGQTGPTYVEQTRRSNRVTLPVTPFTPFTQKDFRKLSEEEIKSLTLGEMRIETPAPGPLRLTCPYPKCGFKTSRGALGLKEHTMDKHKRSIGNSNDSQTPITVDLMATQKSDSGGLHCTYPNCAYVTDVGNRRQNLYKHVQRKHKKQSSATPMPLTFGETHESENIEYNSSINIRAKQLFRCTYDGCSFSTDWGLYQLKRHIRANHTAQTTVRPKPLASTALINKIKAQNINSNNENKNQMHGKRGTILRCSKCSFKTIWGLSKLKNHMNIHNRELAFKCDQCGASYGTNQHLIRHKKFRHKIVVNRPTDKSATDNWRNGCTFCDRNFRRPSDLKRHMISAHNIQKSHTSSGGRDSLNREAKLSALLRNHLTDFSPTVVEESKSVRSQAYECPHTDCPFTTDKIGLLQKHVITHMNLNNNNDCTFNTPKNRLLQTHVITHMNLNKKKSEGNRQVIKELSFIDANGNEMSSDEEVMPATPKTWDNSSYEVLKSNKKSRELRSNHPKKAKIPENNEELNSETTPLSKRLMQSLFKCDANDCTFTSTNSEDWIKHNDWHELEDKRAKQREEQQNRKRFKCIRCSKAYTKLSLLKAHQRLKKHSSYDCGHCEQVFRSVNQLKEHILTLHNGQSGQGVSEPQPAVKTAIFCDFVDCNKRFLSFGNKRIHMERVHNMGVQPMLGSELLNQMNNNVPIEPNSNVYIACPYVRCHQSFKLRAQMITHFNKVHKHIADVLINITDECTRCPEPTCGQLFNNDVNMRRHNTQKHKTITGNSISKTSIQSIHSNIPQINPELFANSFNDNNEFYNEVKGYLCQRSGCGKWFDSALNLREHLNLEHNRSTDILDNSSENPGPQPCVEQNNRCDICDIDMASAAEVELHFRYVHFQSQPIEEIQTLDVDMNNINEPNDSLYADNWLLSQGMTSELPFEPIVEPMNSEDNTNLFVVNNENVLIKSEMY